MLSEAHGCKCAAIQSSLSEQRFSCHSPRTATHHQADRRRASGLRHHVAGPPLTFDAHRLCTPTLRIAICKLLSEHHEHEQVVVGVQKRAPASASRVRALSTIDAKPRSSESPSRHRPRCSLKPRHRRLFTAHAAPGAAPEFSWAAHKRRLYNRLPQVRCSSDAITKRKDKSACGRAPLQVRRCKYQNSLSELRKPPHTPRKARASQQRGASTQARLCTAPHPRRSLTTAYTTNCCLQDEVRTPS